MNIAITGSEGFLGTHLTRSLMRRHNVAILNRKKHDLLQTATLHSFVERKDIIIHLAGVNRGTFDAMFVTNVLGTQRLAEAIVQFAPSTKLIFVSSVQVYLPESFYGLTKRLAEETLFYYVLNKSLRATTLRMTNLYGPGAKPFYNCVIATFIDQILKNKPITLHGEGKQRRDFLYISDAVAAIEKALKNNEDTIPTLDICSGKKYTLRKTIKIIERVAKKKAMIQHENNNQKDWTFVTEHREAMRKLAWEPKTDLEIGIQNMISAYANR